MDIENCIASVINNRYLFEQSIELTKDHMKADITRCLIHVASLDVQAASAIISKCFDNNINQAIDSSHSHFNKIEECIKILHDLDAEDLAANIPGDKNLIDSILSYKMDTIALIFKILFYSKNMTIVLNEQLIGFISKTIACNDSPFYADVLIASLYYASPETLTIAEQKIQFSQTFIKLLVNRVERYKKWRPINDYDLHSSIFSINRDSLWTPTFGNSSKLLKSENNCNYLSLIMNTAIAALEVDDTNQNIVMNCINICEYDVSTRLLQKLIRSIHGGNHDKFITWLFNDINLKIEYEDKLVHILRLVQQEHLSSTSDFSSLQSFYESIESIIATGRYSKPLSNQLASIAQKLKIIYETQALKVFRIEFLCRTFEECVKATNWEEKKHTNFIINLFLLWIKLFKRSSTSFTHTKDDDLFNIQKLNSVFNEVFEKRLPKIEEVANKVRNLIDSKGCNLSESSIPPSLRLWLASIATEPANIVVDHNKGNEVSSSMIVDNEKVLEPSATAVSNNNKEDDIITALKEIILEIKSSSVYQINDKLQNIKFCIESLSSNGVKQMVSLTSRKRQVALEFWKLGEVLGAQSHVETDRDKQELIKQGMMMIWIEALMGNYGENTSCAALGLFESCKNTTSLQASQTLSQRDQDKVDLLPVGWLGNILKSIYKLDKCIQQGNSAKKETNTAYSIIYEILGWIWCFKSAILSLSSGSSEIAKKLANEWFENASPTLDINDGNDLAQICSKVDMKMFLVRKSIIDLFKALMLILVHFKSIFFAQPLNEESSNDSHTSQESQLVKETNILQDSLLACEFSLIFCKDILQFLQPSSVDELGCLITRIFVKNSKIYLEPSATLLIGKYLPNIGPMERLMINHIFMNMKQEEGSTYTICEKCFKDSNPLECLWYISKYHSHESASLIDSVSECLEIDPLPIEICKMFRNAKVSSNMEQLSKEISNEFHSLSSQLSKSISRNIESVLPNLYRLIGAMCYDSSTRIFMLRSMPWNDVMARLRDYRFKSIQKCSFILLHLVSGQVAHSRDHLGVHPRTPKRQDINLLLSAAKTFNICKVILDVGVSPARAESWSIENTRCSLSFVETILELCICDNSSNEENSRNEDSDIREAIISTSTSGMILIFGAIATKVSVSGGCKWITDVSNDKDSLNHLVS